MKSREPQFHLRRSSELRERDFHSLWLGSTIFDFLSWCGFRSLFSYQPRQRIKRNKRKKNKASLKKEENKNGERRKIDWDQVHCCRYFFTFFTLPNFQFCLIYFLSMTLASFPFLDYYVSASHSLFHFWFLCWFIQ